MTKLALHSWKGRFKHDLKSKSTKHPKKLCLYIMTKTSKRKETKVRCGESFAFSSSICFIHSFWLFSDCFIAPPRLYFAFCFLPRAKKSDQKNKSGKKVVFSGPYFGLMNVNMHMHNEIWFLTYPKMWKKRKKTWKVAIFVILLENCVFDALKPWKSVKRAENIPFFAFPASSSEFAPSAIFLLYFPDFSEWGNSSALFTMTSFFP